MHACVWILACVLLHVQPTSGLDAFMAESVVRQLQQLAQSGRCVVATIHQPSSDVYTLFSKVRAPRLVPQQSLRSLIDLLWDVWHHPPCALMTTNRITSYYCCVLQVMLLSEGRVVYFGPTNLAINYFAHHGYQCPMYKCVSP